MYDEIIATIPWSCGESDCPVGWHKSNYWLQVDGTFTVDTYGDGDHEDADESEVPAHDEIEDAWSNYYADCAETGTDPLNELPVKDTFIQRQRWQVDFRQSIAGPVLLGYRRNGRGPWISPRSDRRPPQDLIDYLCLTGGNCLAFRAEWLSEDGETMADRPIDELKRLADDDENVRVHSPRSQVINGYRRRRALLLTVTVDVKVPNPNIERDIKRAAKRAAGRGIRRRMCGDGLTRQERMVQHDN